MKFYTCFRYAFGKKRKRTCTGFTGTQPETKSRYPIAIIMRTNLVVFFLALFCLKTSASAYGQNINLSVKNAPLEKVLSLIEKQSGYLFWYEKDILKEAKPVDLSLNNSTLTQAIDACLKDQKLIYTIKGKTIILKAKAIAADKKIFKVININGSVQDEQGQPLSGATVKIKGTNISTITNDKGMFSLDNIEIKAVLQISFVGYDSKEVSVKEGMQITLIKSSSKLDEVQVIAYGTTTKRLNTGSVSSLKAADIEKQPVSNPIATLQGRVPGLVINQANGMPGAAFSVQIRGRNSISQGTEPLYIIDGIPFDVSNPTQSVSLGDINVNNPFNSINPADIESIDVLKDADATSIYGSRGANGVILITTKKGKAGNLNFNVDAYTGWSKVTRTLNLMDGIQYRQLRREALANDNLPININNAPELTVLDTAIVNDWKDISYGNTAVANNLNLRVTGGNENTQFAIGAGYNYQTTVFSKSNSASRKSLNFSVQHATRDKRLVMNLNTFYSKNISNLIPFDVTENVYKPPYGYTLLDANGNLVWDAASVYFGNPINRTYSKYDGNTNLLTTAGNISYTVLSGLKIKLAGGFTNLTYAEKVLTPLSSLDPRQNGTGEAVFANTFGKTWNLEPQLEYHTDFNKDYHLTALIGGTWQQKENNKDKII